jgi:hypothetical protein
VAGIVAALVILPQVGPVLAAMRGRWMAGYGVAGSGRGALHPVFARWRLTAGGRHRRGDRAALGWLAARFRLADGRDTVAVNRCLNVRNGEKYRATNTAKADDPGGLPCRQGAPRNADGTCGLIGPEIEARQRRSRLPFPDCCQSIHAITRALACRITVLSESRP